MNRVTVFTPFASVVFTLYIPAGSSLTLIVALLLAFTATVITSRPVTSVITMDFIAMALFQVIFSCSVAGFGNNEIEELPLFSTMPVQAVTSIDVVAESVQPAAFVNVYVICCVPNPVAPALKVEPVTPFPLHVPPEGPPPVKANGPSSTQIELTESDTLTTGSAFTTTSVCAVALQPSESVPVTV